MALEDIRRFEPILYFHKDEDFFPSDAKRYMERCSLYKAVKPFDNILSWEKRIGMSSVVARSGEVTTPDDVYIGTAIDGGFPHLTAAPSEELFLNMWDWMQPDRLEGEEVITGGFEALTPDSKNLLPASRKIKWAYDEFSDTADPLLVDSRFWYHAEEFTEDRLRALLANQRFSDHNFIAFLSNFSHPHIVCYYLFFPFHQEGLTGCEYSPIGPHYASFSGEWTAVVLLLDRLDPNGVLQPRFAGLASRNTQNALAIDQEQKTGMVIHPWNTLKKFPESPDHPCIFIAKGTHSFYTTPGEKDLSQVNAAQDTQRKFCGANEQLYYVLEPYDGPSTPVALLKLLSPLMLPYVSGAALVAGMIWLSLEASVPFGSAAQPAPADPQKDHPPAGDYGIVLHPAGFIPPDIGTGKPVAWPALDTVVINGRQYARVVNRTSTEEDERTTWLPPLERPKGYTGLWGTRVAQDPYHRRAGMHFPEFWQQFMIALHKFMRLPQLEP